MKRLYHNKSHTSTDLSEKQKQKTQTQTKPKTFQQILQTIELQKCEDCDEDRDGK